MRVSRANIARFLWYNKGMANRLLMLSNTQFSTLRLASSHIPAHAVDDTHESQIGTVEGVNLTRMIYNIPHPPKTINRVINHSRLLEKLTFTAGRWRFFIQWY